MDAVAAERALDTYRQVRKSFFQAGESLFGPGVMSMAEYYFTRKTGKNPFSLMALEPRIVYNEWVGIFKGERVVAQLIEKAIGPESGRFLDDMKSNDAIRTWSALERLASRESNAPDAQSRFHNGTPV